MSKRKIIAEANKAIVANEEIIALASTLPDDPTTTTEPPATTTTTEEPEPTTTTTEEPEIDSEFSSESSSSSISVISSTSSGIIPPNGNEIPRLLIPHHGGEHGDLVPDFAALPEAVSITSLDQITDGIVAIVEEGVTLEVDRLMDRNVVPEAICIKGTLRFNRVNDIRLVADTLFQYPGGTLDAGTHDDPLLGDVEIVTATRPIDTVRDPEQFIGGCVFTGGVVNIHGSFTGAHRARLTRNVHPDDTEIEVDTVDQWKIDDEVILSDTRDTIRDYGPNHTHERRTIVSISGLTVGLSAPATYFHNMYANVGGVAHVERNVCFTSPQVDVAHVMIGPMCDARVHSTRRVNYGRTTVDILHDTHRDHMGNVTQVGNQNRRLYAEHVHHSSFLYSSDRNVIINEEDSKTKWAITHHDCEAHFTNNIVFGKCDGAGMAAEDGSETGKWIDNVILGTAGIERNQITFQYADYNRDKAFSDDPNTPGQPLEEYDRGFSGNGLWLAGAFVHVEGNWVSGVFLEGVQYNVKGRTVVVKVGPEARDEPYNMEKEDIDRFFNNDVRAFYSGIVFWEHKDTKDVAGNVVSRPTMTLTDSRIFTQSRSHSAVAAKHIFKHDSSANLILSGCRIEKNNPSQPEKKGAIAWGIGEDNSLVTIDPDTSIVGWDRDFE